MTNLTSLNVSSGYHSSNALIKIKAPRLTFITNRSTKSDSYKITVYVKSCEMGLP